MKKILVSFLSFLMLIGIGLAVNSVVLGAKAETEEQPATMVLTMDAGASFRSYWTTPSCGITYSAKMTVEGNEEIKDKIRLVMFPASWLETSAFTSAFAEANGDYVTALANAGMLTGSGGAVTVKPVAIEDGGYYHFRGGIKNLNQSMTNSKVFGIYYYEHNGEYVYAKLPYGEEGQSRSIAYVASMYNNSSDSLNANDEYMTTFYMNRAVRNIVDRAANYNQQQGQEVYKLNGITSSQVNYAKEGGNAVINSAKFEGIYYDDYLSNKGIEIQITVGEASATLSSTMLDFMVTYDDNFSQTVTNLTETEQSRNFVNVTGVTGENGATGTATIGFNNVSTTVKIDEYDLSSEGTKLVLQDTLYFTDKIKVQDGKIIDTYKTTDITPVVSLLIPEGGRVVKDKYITDYSNDAILDILELEGADAEGYAGVTTNADDANTSDKVVGISITLTKKSNNVLNSVSSIQDNDYTVTATKNKYQITTNYKALDVNGKITGDPYFEDRQNDVVKLYFYGQTYQLLEGAQNYDQQNVTAYLSDGYTSVGTSAIANIITEEGHWDYVSSESFCTTVNGTTTYHEQGYNNFYNLYGTTNDPKTFTNYLNFFKIHGDEAQNRKNYWSVGNNSLNANGTAYVTGTNNDYTAICHTKDTDEKDSASGLMLTLHWDCPDKTPVRAWQAPVSGKIKVEYYFKFNLNIGSSGNNRLGFRLDHNTTQQTLVASTDGVVSGTIEELTVNAGDFIYQSIYGKTTDVSECYVDTDLKIKYIEQYDDVTTYENLEENYYSEGDVYNSSASFSRVQGDNNFYYMYCDIGNDTSGNTFYNLDTFDSGRWKDEATEWCSVSATDMYISSATWNSKTPAYAFKAPKSGIVTVTVKKPYMSFNEGVKEDEKTYYTIELKKQFTYNNGESSNISTLLREQLTATTEEGAKDYTVTLRINKGEYVYLVARSKDGACDGRSVKTSLEVKYLNLIDDDTTESLEGLKVDYDSCEDYVMGKQDLVTRQGTNNFYYLHGTQNRPETFTGVCVANGGSWCRRGSSWTSLTYDSMWLDGNNVTYTPVRAFKVPKSGQIQLRLSAWGVKDWGSTNPTQMAVQLFQNEKEIRTETSMIGKTVYYVYTLNVTAGDFIYVSIYSHDLHSTYKTNSISVGTQMLISYLNYGKSAGIQTVTAENLINDVYFKPNLQVLITEYKAVDANNEMIVQDTTHNLARVRHGHKYNVNAKNIVGYQTATSHVSGTMAADKDSVAGDKMLTITYTAVGINKLNESYLDEGGALFFDEFGMQSPDLARLGHHLPSDPNDDYSSGENGVDKVYDGGSHITIDATTTNEAETHPFWNDMNSKIWLWDKAANNNAGNYIEAEQFYLTWEVKINALKQSGNTPKWGVILDRASVENYKAYFIYLDLCDYDADGDGQNLGQDGGDWKQTTDATQLVGWGVHRWDIGTDWNNIGGSGDIAKISKMDYSEGFVKFGLWKTGDTFILSMNDNQIASWDEDNYSQYNDSTLGNCRIGFYGDCISYELRNVKFRASGGVSGETAGGYEVKGEQFPKDKDYEMYANTNSNNPSYYASADITLTENNSTNEWRKIGLVIKTVTTEKSNYVNDTAKLTSIGTDSYYFFYLDLYKNGEGYVTDGFEKNPDYGRQVGLMKRTNGVDDWTTAKTALLDPNKSECFFDTSGGGNHGTNKLAVYKRGKYMTFLVNDVPIFSVEDEDYASSSVVGFLSYKQSFKFENFRYTIEDYVFKAVEQSLGVTNVTTTKYNEYSFNGYDGITFDGVINDTEWASAGQNRAQHYERNERGFDEGFSVRGFLGRQYAYFAWEITTGEYVTTNKGDWYVNTNVEIRYERNKIDGTSAARQGFWQCYVNSINASSGVAIFKLTTTTENDSNGNPYYKMVVEMAMPYSALLSESGTDTLRINQFAVRPNNNSTNNAWNDYFMALRSTTYSVTAHGIVRDMTLEVYEPKTEFALGEKFSVGENFAVGVAQEDGTILYLKENEYTIDSSKFIKDTIGTYTITVTSKLSGESKSYSVSVGKGIKAELDKTYYYLDRFDPTALKVYYVEGSNSPILLTSDKYTVDYNGYSSNVGTSYVTVKYKPDADSDKEYTTTIAVKVHKREAFKLLMIGNSFSRNTVKYMHQIAQNLGYNDVVIVNVYRGGATIENHYQKLINGESYTINTNDVSEGVDTYSNGVWTYDTNDTRTLTEIIKSDSWDFISLQESSPLSGKETGKDNLQALINGILGVANADVKLLWNMTWAYQPGTIHGAFADYGSNQDTMYQSIVNVVQNVVVKETYNGRDAFDLVMPLGTAIQNVRTSFIGQDIMLADGYHLDENLGSYIAGVAAIASITGWDLSELDYAPNGYFGAYGDAIIEAVQNAINNPYKVTQSTFTSEPKDYENTDLYTPYDYFWTRNAYWKSDDAVATQFMVNDSDTFNQKFAATMKFTQLELPVGSILVFAEGWKYRPEVWLNDGKQDSRMEEESKIRYLYVDEFFWQNAQGVAYKYRAFNLSRIDGLVWQEGDKVDNVLKIYTPNSASYKEIAPSEYGFKLGKYYGNSTANNQSSNNTCFVTKTFTRAELPIGSIIVKTGDDWTYHHFGWATESGGATDYGVDATERYLLVTEEWWGNDVLKAFNVGSVSGGDISTVATKDLCDVFKIYLPTDARVLDNLVCDGTTNGTVVFDYWYDSCNVDGADIHTTDTDANLCDRFAAINIRFTKETLPVGSMIYLTNSAWRYRAESWTYYVNENGELVTERTPGSLRHANSNATILIITEDFWEDPTGKPYLYRAFHLSKRDGNAMTLAEAQTIPTFFKIIRNVGTLTISDVTVGYGERIALEKIFSHAGFAVNDSDITYSYSGEGVSIENGEVSGNTANAVVTVTAKTPYHTATFTVTVGADYSFSIADVTVKVGSTVSFTPVFGDQNNPGAITYTCNDKNGITIDSTNNTIKANAVGEYVVSATRYYEVNGENKHYATYFTVTVEEDYGTLTIPDVVVNYSKNESEEYNSSATINPQFSTNAGVSDITYTYDASKITIEGGVVALLP